MHFKKLVISTALSLTLLLPSAAFANNGNLTEGADLNKSITTEKVSTQSPELTPEIKDKIKDLKIKVRNGEITNEQFHQEVKKILPKDIHFKHKKFNLSNQEKEQLKELKIKLENGEITKEEFKEEMKTIFPKPQER